MNPLLRRVALILVSIIAIVVLLIAFLARKPVPEHIEYGISFNVPYALELGLDPLAVLGALTDELGIKRFRLAAHWPLIEPRKGAYDFSLMDAQVKKVTESGGSFILAVGRRLPRWPECHIPSWTDEMSWDEQKAELRDYLSVVVNRYKDSPGLRYWQIENEPFLTVFAYEHCGELDTPFLDEEIALVRSLDPVHPILITDSGNLGTWNGAYSRGDVFGTSVYVYFWNPDIGKFKTVLPPWFYRTKEGFMEVFHGKKETMLVELSLEPWLLEPVGNVPLDVQFSRMNTETFDEIIEYARDTRYEEQYLWGGEWWYWLREQGENGMWERARSLFES